MKRWKESEVKFLIEYYSRTPTICLSRKLNRTALSIWKKAKSLGLILTDDIKFANRSIGHKDYLPNGGKKKNYKGYVLVLNKQHPRADSNGYIFEHIVVAENKIGRRIMGNEVVHHINEIKNDNRPENLIVLTKSEHTKLHNKERRLLKNEQSNTYRQLNQRA